MRVPGIYERVAASRATGLVLVQVPALFAHGRGDGQGQMFEHDLPRIRLKRSGNGPLMDRFALLFAD